MNEAVVKEARSWLGVRWQHQGRTRDGVDCAGLVIKVAQALGYTRFDTSDYARQAVDETMLELCARHMQPVLLAAIEPGDVVVMRFENQRHMGIVGDYFAGGLSLVHAYALAPHRVVEGRLDSVWAARIIGAFRFAPQLGEAA